MRFLKTKFICSDCAKKQTELYAGEIWEPGDILQESWWKGENYPLCTECSLYRTLETFTAFTNANSFLSAIGAMP